MAPRLELHSLLQTITENVYFQPPQNTRMLYPCIVYQRDYADTKFADNEPWNVLKRYQVTVIDRDPDSEIPDQVAQLPRCTFNRFFVADDLNHDVYQLFF
jgi:hypothetical protein